VQKQNREYNVDNVTAFMEKKMEKQLRNFVEQDPIELPRTQLQLVGWIMEHYEELLPIINTHERFKEACFEFQKQQKRNKARAEKRAKK
jgi:hypothetical protein